MHRDCCDFQDGSRFQLSFWRDLVFLPFVTKNPREPGLAPAMRFPDRQWLASRAMDYVLPSSWRWRVCVLVMVVASIRPAACYKTGRVVMTPFCRAPFLADPLCQYFFRTRSWGDIWPFGCLGVRTSVMSGGGREAEQSMRSKRADRLPAGPLLEQRQVAGTGGGDVGIARR